MIITIIVLLILAGVALATLTGQGNIIGNAEKVVGEYNNSVIEEQKLLNEIEKYLQGIGNNNPIEDNKAPEMNKSEWNGKVQSPMLLEGMTAVYWSKDGGVTASTTEEGSEEIYSKIDSNGKASSTGTENPNFKWSNWYNYVAGNNSTDTKTSRWANVVTDDGSYWVWIPRYKYKISEEPTEAGVNNAGKVDVEFIPTTEKMGSTGYTTGANSEGEILTTDGKGYIIHPAFENGSSTGKNNGYANGEWDSELAGFWIAKYEMSMEDGSGNALNTDEVGGDVLISDTVKMVSKPNVLSWRDITIGNSYTNCYNYDRDNESHLIKMSEWGAVAYLTHSQYGRNRNEVTINNSYTTANVGELGSTTGNIYGVYDMNGGAWERVAAWDTLSTSGNITSYGSSFASSGGTSTKYATAYKNGTGTYSGVLAKTVCKTGDAVRETYTNSDRGWFNDYSYFASTSHPFFVRGGNYEDGEGAGVFASSSTTGEPYANNSFRAVLVAAV